MIKIGICDDDLDCIKACVKLLESEIMQQNLDAEITVATNNQTEIFNAIYNNDLDVLFLDIDFKGKGKSGLEFAKDLRDVNKNFYLIFLSAHFKYVHVSLANKVFDFLVKPLNRDTIEILISRLKDEFDKNNLIFLKLNKWNSIRIDTIFYIEKINNKCKVVTNTDSLYTTKTLNTLLDELPNSFCKCHRSYIANTDKILRVDKKEGLIYFSKDIRCPISPLFNPDGGDVNE